MDNIKKRLKELFVQFDCDYNLMCGDIEEMLRQKNIVYEKLWLYDVPLKELKEGILKMQTVISEVKGKQRERWTNLEAIISAMLKLLNRK